MHTAKRLVLVAEDEAPLATALCQYFAEQGFGVELADDGVDAVACMAEATPDLALIGWMIPRMSGIDVCRHIRRVVTYRLPIIVTGKRNGDRDVVEALNAGADLYVTKPYNMDVLLARVGALLRRAGPMARAQPIGFLDVTMDLLTHRVQRNGRPLQLGHTEYRMLRILLEHPRRVFSREELREALWGPDTPIQLRTIDVHIARLRRSINAPGEEGLVHTIRSAGYALTADPVRRAAASRLA